jgi:hypothetical protein
MINPTMQTIKQAIRNPYAWPGGHALFFLTVHGESMCMECARLNFKQIVASNKLGFKDGWTITGLDSAANYDEPPICDDCCKLIE